MCRSQMHDNQNGSCATQQCVRRPRETRDQQLNGTINLHRVVKSSSLVVTFQVAYVNMTEMVLARRRDVCPENTVKNSAANVPTSRRCPDSSVTRASTSHVLQHTSCFSRVVSLVLCVIISKTHNMITLLQLMTTLLSLKPTLLVMTLAQRYQDQTRISVCSQISGWATLRGSQICHFCFFHEKEPHTIRQRNRAVLPQYTCSAHFKDVGCREEVANQNP